MEQLGSFDVDGCWPTQTTGVAIATEVGRGPANFVVEELDAYPATGAGEHLFVRLQKQGISTLEAVKRLSRAVGVKPSEIGFAGRKDARGKTTQRFSLPARVADRVPEVLGEQIKILDRQLHKNKLRMGHLTGNKFQITCSAIGEEEKGILAQRVAAIEQQGVPNYYGVQRFGSDFSSAIRGIEMLLAQKGRGKRRQVDFLISAAQSLLFNDYVARRVTEGTQRTALQGDLLKTEKGGLFNCEEPETDTKRLEANEIRVTGPMFGRKMMPSFVTSMTLESEILAKRGLTFDHFSSFVPPISGTRRPILVFPWDVSLKWPDENTVLQFALPAGSYATVVLREIFRIPFDSF